jgi:hypothetical protein
VIQEVWDLLDQDSQQVQDWDSSEGQSKQVFMVLSTATILGADAPRTLKIQRVIQAIEILILNNSGSSHSFLSEHLSPLLIGVSLVPTPTQVQVANGQTLHSTSEMLDAIWSIQGF